MKFLLAKTRSKALFSIAIVAISIGAISKKLINYPAGWCIKGLQELTLKKEINNFIILWIVFSFGLYFLYPVNLDNSSNVCTPKIIFPLISHEGKPSMFLSIHNWVWLFFPSLAHSTTLSSS